VPLYSFVQKLTKSIHYENIMIITLTNSPSDKSQANIF
jgi:hypothetical protein